MNDRGAARPYERFPAPPYIRRLIEEFGRAAVAEMGAPSYVHPNPAARWLAWRKVAVAARLIGAEPIGAALDFGCGVGTMLRFLASHARTVYGADLDIAVAQRVCADHGLESVTLLPADRIEEIGQGSLDLVVALEVLEHVDNVDAALANFERLLRPGGRLVVSVPTENWLYRLGRRMAGFRPGFHHRGSAAVRSRLDARFRRTRRVCIPPLVPLYEVMAYAK